VTSIELEPIDNGQSQWHMSSVPSSTTRMHEDY
jgi:hypothetical protein